MVDRIDEFVFVDEKVVVRVCKSAQVTRDSGSGELWIQIS